ncbi:MAG: hypothetical protein ACK48F_13405, partial [Chryseotalea sp.]
MRGVIELDVRHKILDVRLKKSNSCLWLLVSVEVKVGMRSFSHITYQNYIIQNNKVHDLNRGLYYFELYN